MRESATHLLELISLLRLAHVAGKEDEAPPPVGQEAVCEVPGPGICQRNHGMRLEALRGRSGQQGGAVETSEKVTHLTVRQARRERRLRSGATSAFGR